MPDIIRIILRRSLMLRLIFITKLIDRCRVSAGIFIKYRFN